MAEGGTGIVEVSPVKLASPLNLASDARIASHKSLTHAQRRCNEKKYNGNIMTHRMMVILDHQPRHPASSLPLAAPST